MTKPIHTLIKENWASGLTVGLVSIPIAVSLAVASHASPIAGIITAMWSGLIASLFGGSNYNIIGPTGALAGLLFLYANTFGPECLPILAMLSGALVFVAYLCRLEKYLTFIPGSALHGFILGIAIIIICSQFNTALGLKNIPHRDNIIYGFYESLKHVDMLHLPTLAVFSAMLIGLLLFAYFTPRLPGSIVLTPFGILVGYLSVEKIIPWELQTLGAKFPMLDVTLFQLPSFHFRLSYIFPALSIATISILETMISARIADGATKTKHNKRKEMFGLSLANIGSGLAGGIPATAALARTALNIRSGCTHSASATISSFFIAFISLLFLHYFHYLPSAILAAILVFVSIRMLEMEHFLRMFKIDKKNLMLSLVVAGVTVYEDAVIGILLGAVIAMLLFMEKLSAGYHEIMVKSKEQQAPISPTVPYEPETLVYSIKGPFAYINAQAHIARLDNIAPVYTDVILNLQDVHFIDLDGVEALSDIIHGLGQKNKSVAIAGLNPVVEQLLHQSTRFKDLQKNNRVFADVNQALINVSQRSI